MYNCVLTNCIFPDNENELEILKLLSHLYFLDKSNSFWDWETLNSQNPRSYEIMRF